MANEPPKLPVNPGVAILALVALGYGLTWGFQTAVTTLELGDNFTLMDGISLAQDASALREKIAPYKESLLLNDYTKLGIFGTYLVSTVFMLPLFGFHTVVGFVYDRSLVEAVLLITTTQALCAGAAFSASRYVVRPWVKHFMHQRYGSKYKAIDAAVSKQGLKITTLLRLSPIIPFGMNNYLCGCTEMKLWEFVLGTWLGVLLGNTVYCKIGSMGADEEKPLWLKVVTGVAMLLVAYVVNKLATDALKEAGIRSDADEAAIASPTTAASPPANRRRRSKSPSAKVAKRKVVKKKITLPGPKASQTPKTKTPKRTPRRLKAVSTTKKKKAACKKNTEGLDLVWVQCMVGCNKWRLTNADDPDIKGKWNCSKEFWHVKSDEWRTGCKWSEDKW